LPTPLKDKSEEHVFPHLGLGELVVLLVIVLLLFGPQRLPQVAASFGKAIKSFKEGLRGDSKEDVKSDKPS
jgi:sec-independent protein translocase protein TatA